MQGSAQDAIKENPRETNILVTENLTSSGQINEVNDSENIPENQPDHEKCLVNIKIESNGVQNKLAPENDKVRYKFFEYLLNSLHILFQVKIWHPNIQIHWPLFSKQNSDCSNLMNY